MSLIDFNAWPKFQSISIEYFLLKMISRADRQRYKTPSFSFSLYPCQRFRLYSMYCLINKFMYLHTDRACGNNRIFRFFVMWNWKYTEICSLCRMWLHEWASMCVCVCVSTNNIQVLFILSRQMHNLRLKLHWKRSLHKYELVLFIWHCCQIDSCLWLKFTNTQKGKYDGNATNFAVEWFRIWIRFWV